MNLLLISKASILRNARLCFFPFLLGACVNEKSNELHLIDWSGNSGIAISLEQPLRLKFSQSLHPNLRKSSVKLEDTLGKEVGDYEIEIAGSYLTIIPNLPLAENLSDSGFPAGKELRLRLMGIPSLAAISGQDGAVLTQDLVLPFRTLNATHPDALSGVIDKGGTMHIELLQFENILSAANGELDLPFSHPIDPRSLKSACNLNLPGLEDSIPVNLSLLENERTGSVVRATLGFIDKWGILEFSETLCGFGGIPLDVSQRQLRIAPNRQQDLEIKD